MTSITVAVPDELAEKARAIGLLDPVCLAPLVCEALTRATSGTMRERGFPEPSDSRSLSEALLSLAGAAGPGLLADFAANHGHCIHGSPK